MEDDFTVATFAQPRQNRPPPDAYENAHRPKISGTALERLHMRLQVLEKSLCEASDVAGDIVTRLIGEGDNAAQKGASPAPVGLLSNFQSTIEHLEHQTGLLRSRLQQLSDLT